MPSERLSGFVLRKDSALARFHSGAIEPKDFGYVFDSGNVSLVV